jgi:hypothetical protein
MSFDVYTSPDINVYIAAHVRITSRAAGYVDTDECLSFELLAAGAASV